MQHVQGASIPTMDAVALRGVSVSKPPCERRPALRAQMVIGHGDIKAK